MQLKFKKSCLLGTLFIYCASFLIQSNLGLFQVLAKGDPEPVNIVAILVDDRLYSSISDKLSWYATEYVQKKVYNSKALVIPINPEISAYDIHRMMENIYFDGLSGVNSTLVGLIMFGDIPLPVVNQNGYIFPTVYPYVDFEDQKYVWDPYSEYFVPNGNSAGQAEVWHGLINYGTDADPYVNEETGFFKKVEEHDKNPDEFIGKSIWYDDFISQKKGFLDENFPYYRNRIMFAEDLGYQRYSPLMKGLFEGEQFDNALDIASQLDTDLDETLISQMKESLGDNHTTKMVQQEIDSSFVSDYNDLFSQNGSSIMRENIFAGSRWIKEYANDKGEKSLVVDADGSISKLQLKDDLLLGNENIEGLIENLNDLMENMIDKKIEEKHLAMDIVVPVSYEKVKKKRIDRRCRSLVDRYENYYFGNNARFIDKAEDLSIYRGTYRNLSSISGLAYDSMLSGKNQIKSDYDMTNLKLKSIGGSYDIFSMQVEGNRGYNMFNVDGDLDIYDENKTQKDAEVKHKGLGKLRVRSWPESCNDDDEDEVCENLFDFAMRWWGGASPINLDGDTVGKGRYELSGYLATDSWRPIYGMNGFQSVLVGDDEGFYGTGWKNGKGKGPQRDATNFMSYIKYASPTQREGWRTRRWIFFRGYETYQNHTPDVHMDFKDINYRDLTGDIIEGSANANLPPVSLGFLLLRLGDTPWFFSKLADKMFSISRELDGCGGGGSEEYVYKVISSVIKHSSTSEDQINGIDRDKYGETGTLGKYYHDVKVEYEDLYNTLSGTIEAFSGLVVAVNSGNDYLSGKFNALKSLIRGGNSSVPNTGLQDELLNLETQLSGLQIQLSGLEAQLDSVIQGSVSIETGNDENFEEWGVIESGQLEVGNFEPEVQNSSDRDLYISGLELEIEGLKQNILELEEKIQSVKSQITAGGGTFQTVLDEISEYINRERAQLSNAYGLVMSLYTDNIIGALEFIVYLEGGQPEDYLGSNSSNLVKIGFLPSWIDNIKGMHLDIMSGENKVISGYDEIFSLIQEQQEYWFNLTEQLKEINGNYSDSIDKVTLEMEQIFTLLDDGKYYDENGNEILYEDSTSFNNEVSLNDGVDNEVEEEEEPIVLTGGTVSDAMEIFSGELSNLSKFFSNLIKKDTIGPAIIQAAKNDGDFTGWLAKNSINYNEFSDVDWINQYAQWAKGPGYDSVGAKKNYDLLLGASEHMSGMNLLTPDRPIDSPRYVSMQSVAGREMKFIYPDLFKVEVYELSGKNHSGYDINLLLTGGQIKKNLVKYLTGKVAEYNKILQIECDNALSMNNHYLRLQEMSYSGATPEKDFHSCGLKAFTYEDFLEALGGEKMLDTISEVLYYQSLTNKRKLSAGNIDEDLEFIKHSFSLNNKRKQILEDYLVEGNEKIKNPIFEIPTYDFKGYEVGYINSNGKDYIFPSEEINEKTSNYEFRAGASIVKNDSDFLDTHRRQPSDEANRDDDECGIPIDGKLLLFDGTGSPWLSGFNCWLKQVKEKPFKLNLKFDDSLGETIDLFADFSLSNFKDYLKDSDLGESLIARSESWSSYKDEWNEILGKDATSDYDAEITQIQVTAEKHNKEVSSGGDGVSNLMANIDRDIRIESSSLILSETNPIIDLKISSVSDLKNIKVTFEGTGDGCIKINSVSLCDGNKFVAYFDPMRNPFTGKIASVDNVAGKVGLIMNMEAAGSSIKKVIKYTVNPGAPKTISLKVRSDGTNKVVVVGGMMLPINATLYDKDDNVVSRGTEKYKFAVTTGRFLKDGGYMSSFETNDFRDLDFYYEVPQDYEGEIDIQVLDQGNVVRGTLPIHVIKATLETKIDEILIGDKEGACHRLGYWDPLDCVPCTHSSCSPSLTCTQGRKVILSKNVFEDIYDGGKLDVSQLHKIDIDLKDKDGKLVNLDSQAIVTSKKGLLVIGKVNKKDNGDDVFFETSKFYMTGGHFELYYYLSTVAGDDELNIDVPGVISRTVGFQIQEHTCKSSSAKLRNGYVEIGVLDFIEFFNADIFGNVIGGGGASCYDQTKVDFPATAEKLPNCLACGRNEEADECNYYFKDGRNKIDIIGVGAGTTEIAGLQFEVAEPLVPDSGLNIMYLNYFGNDWGNQWGYRSNNNKRVEGMMTRSKKLITTTTQLVSEDKIKKLVWRLDPGLKIVNLDNLDTTMEIIGNNVFVRPNGELSDGIPVSVGFGNNSVKNVDSLGDIYSWFLDPKKERENYIFYVSSESGYELTSRMDIYDNGEKVGNFYSGDFVIKLNNQTMSNGDNIWNVVYNGVNYGNIVIHSPNSEAKDFVSTINTRYSVGRVFTKGTTSNMSSIGVFDEFSDFELNTSYKSIQNSDEIDERVGFIGDFKNITLFGEGQSVGEATKKFGSELLINLGDPILSLKKDELNENSYGMNYDGGIGREVFEDADKSIFKTFMIAFESKTKKDLLVAYTDGTFKLAKNYAKDSENYDMKNLQELMRLAVPIRDIFVGDVDGNGFDDIIVYTNNNQMRAYLNQGGTFDVDGNLICLNQNVYGGERSSTPSDLQGINQIFIEDMDLDGAADIITYDAKGYIKVFYGGGRNYLSQEKYACDRGWYSRQQGKVTEVAAFGLNIGGENLDDSMMYWVGITGQKLAIDDPSEFGINIDLDNLENLIESRDRDSDGSIEDLTREIMDKDNFDVGEASRKFAEKQSIYVDVTMYEGPLVGGTGKNYLFVPLRYLQDAQSPCRVSKTYHPKTGKPILEDGDIVTVSVNISGGSKCVGAYGDMVNGPRNLYYNKDGTVKSFRFIGGTGTAILRGRDGNFAYVVDNIQGGTSFEYDLEYHHVPLRKMSITYETYWSDDKYPDIKLQSVDGCVKDFSGYVNQKSARKFIGKNIPLQEMIDKEYLEEEDMTEDFTQERFDNGLDVNQIPGIIGDNIARIKFLQENMSVQEISEDRISWDDLKDELLQKMKDGLMNGSFVVDLSLFEKEMENVDAVLDKLMKGMCNGFSFGGANNCKGLPVPFNQAFLAPGKYHLFGCWDLPMGKLEGGVPSFFFPGTLWVPTPAGAPVSIPFPYGFKSPTDGFLRAGVGSTPPAGGAYPSFIRIYAAPTLTAQLGIAICMGKYMDENIFPSPLADVAGNCVVFAVKPQCKNEDKYPNRKLDKNNPNDVYTGITEDVRDSGLCTSSKNSVLKGSNSSPYGLVNYSSEIHVEEPCTTSCTRFNTSNPNCGNGIKNRDETCDNCLIDLRYECKKCGNSRKDPGEQCDNGLRNGHDGECRFDCKLENDGRYCGDGIVQEELGEQCDLGDLNGQFWEKDSIYGGWKNFSWADTRESIWGDVHWDQGFFEDLGASFENIGQLLANMYNNADVEGGQNYQVDFSANYLGIIDMEMSSNVGFDYGDTYNSNNSLFIGDVDVLGGEFKKNEIKGGIQQGIRKFLIDNWLDPQIRYIANQLTKMHVNIKLPDMGGYLNNEIQTVKNLTDEFGNIWKSDEKFDNRVDTGWGSLTDWSYVNYDNLKSLNKTMANPFEALASILNQSNLINISVEPVVVKVPWIFAEDINSYELYLRQRLEVNEDIINQWSGALSSFVIKCGSIENEEEKKKCYDTAEKNLASFIEFKGGDWKRLQSQIYANLNILQEYRNFPFEVYEWIHVIDRYMSEIISLIGNTIGYLSYWTTINAERFVGYVDAIILIINIIKTYQIIPDFSREWSQKCSSCARDTYDQYSCKLSFLCNFQLPIIQIPNFKIPNITLDLSDIDLSLDIVLPSFNFQPIKITLPDLPNLPSPPTISVDIRLFDLPNIPLLPEPPDLPELPSFIPEIDMELPVLPPAPEIPKLPSSIEATLNIVKTFGKLYCIVKGKFGLVGESAVKAKIEQLTQRTYEVSWIDNIKKFTNRTAAPVHNYGLDYEISSHVDLQFDFSVFYDFLDTLTKSINNVTISSVDWANNKIDEAFNAAVYDNDVSRFMNDISDKIDGGSLDFSLDLTKADVYNGDIKGLMSDEIEYTDYDTAKSRFEDVLAYFKSVVSDTTFADSLNSSINKIQNQISKKNVVKPNIEGLNKVESDVITYLNTEKSNYEGLADLIKNDYDGFLAMIDSQDSKFGASSGKLLTFDTQLFDVDSSTKDNIGMIVKENPYEILLDNKKEIVDGYWNAINSNTADDLGVTNSQYLVMRDEIGKMKNNFTSFYSLTRPASSTELVAKNGGNDVNKALLSSATDSQLRLGSNTEVSEIIDPSILSNGIFDKIVYGADVGKLAKIVYSDYFASLIGNKYSHIPQKDYHDVLLWDDKSVYIKCKDQKCFSEGGFSKYYVSRQVNTIPNEETYLEFDKETILKIADVHSEVKNWEVAGQSYDSLSFSWKLEDVDGYLIDLMDRIDYNYEKNYDYLRPIYVLALPMGAPSLDELILSGTKLELIGDSNKKFDEIKVLYGTGKELVQVVYYDSNKDLADIIISNIDRKWYYARISTLDLIGNAYEISSPWSNQVVAGKQILGDEIGPEGDPVLYRPSIKQVVSQGNDLDGYVGTRYNLVVNWKDDVALSYINLSKDGVLLDERYTSESEDSVSTSIDIHTKGGEREVYMSEGIDQFGNKTQKVITVSYSVPEISITDVSKNFDGKTALITAELSQDVDQGNVSFQRRRGDSWKTMRSINEQDSDKSLRPGEKQVIGTYSAGNEIAIYDKNEKVMALMNPDTAEIKFMSGYDEKYGVRVVVEDTLVLQIYDKNTDSSIFSIYVPVEDCSNIDVGNYKISDLKKTGNMGMFNGGKVIYGEGVNVLFISPTCHLYSEGGLKGTYKYDIGSKSLSVVLYSSSDINETNPIKLLLKVKPLTLN